MVLAASSALPPDGNRWSAHRLVIDGIFFRTRAGCPRRDLPERFENCDGAEGRAAWTVAVDATVVRAHQHTAGERHRLPADVDPARLAPAALSSPVRIRG
jgi:hypothetical protein